MAWRLYRLLSVMGIASALFVAARGVFVYGCFGWHVEIAGNCYFNYFVKNYGKFILLPPGQFQFSVW
jgi:hypothetical protein